MIRAVLRAMESARHSRPGCWLVGALAADVATYALAGRGMTGAVLWLLLDLWLAHRSWNGGVRALTVFRFLQTLGAVLFALATFGGPLNVHTAATATVAALYGLSAWCLFAPSLDAVVGRRRSYSSRNTDCGHATSSSAL